MIRVNDYIIIHFFIGKLNDKIFGFDGLQCPFLHEPADLIPLVIG